MRGLFILLTATSAAAGQAVSFVAVSGPPGVPRAISGDGSAVVLQGFTFPFGWTPHRWRPELGFEHLGYPGTASAVSFDGRAISGFYWSEQTGTVASLWTESSGVQWPLTPWVGEGQAISSDGAYVAIGGGTSFSNVVRWHAGQIVSVSPGGTEFADAIGVSTGGGLVVSVVKDKAGPERSYLWREGAGFVEFPRLNPSYAFQARDMSQNGRVVVGVAGLGSGQSAAARWTAHGIRQLFPTESASAALVSGDGWTVVGGSAQFPSTRFIWDPVHGPRDFREQLSLWGITAHQEWAAFEPVDISSDGRTVVGHGHEGTGQYAMWVATIPAFCYANCDGSTASPGLNVADFTCFLRRFASGDVYGNCDNDGFINVADFVCFLQKFAAGCP